MKRQIILFDLDGTLVESEEGIIKSIQYAADKLNLPAKTALELRPFIGPPLLEQFMAFYDLDKATAEKAVAFYRERYAPIGVLECQLYPGIKNMLEELKNQGFILGVASSKPETFVKQVIEHFDLTENFSAIVGSTFTAERNTKGLVIQEAIKRLEANPRKDSIVMVGDKEHDVFGAREQQIPCVAVLYGYGSKEELELAQPLQIVESVNELTKILKKIS